MRQQGLAGFGGGDSSTDSVKKSHVQLLFKLRYAFTDSRLREMQFLGGQRKRAGFSDEQESSEILCIHFSIPKWNSYNENNKFELLKDQAHNLPATAKYADFLTR
jgi:hypothetical protein